ncbi:MAG TPA: diguanylate cyclase, partial [Pseudomonadales bacterium]|nr:diguanylate cyclase [Pseudomonadales bacterium]
GDGTPYPVGQCRIYDAFRTGVASRTQVESLWRADGTTLSVEYSSHPLRVGDKILGAVLVFRDVTEAQARATRLAWQASHDALTGLVNRREFEIRLANAIDSARSKGDAHALCYLDLDHFKAVNDNCGHAAGDELLRHVSQLLHQRLRQRDTLARLGGDEFGVLLEHCPVGKAVEIARELCAVVRELRFTWEGHEFRIGASIGVAPIDSSVRDVATLMSAADAACYAAKAAGRGRVHLVDETVAQAPHVRP